MLLFAFYNQVPCVDCLLFAASVVGGARFDPQLLWRYISSDMNRMLTAAGVAAVAVFEAGCCLSTPSVLARAVLSFAGCERPTTAAVAAVAAVVVVCEYSLSRVVAHDR